MPVLSVKACSSSSTNSHSTGQPSEDRQGVTSSHLRPPTAGLQWEAADPPTMSAPGPAPTGLPMMPGRIMKTTGDSGSSSFQAVPILPSVVLPAKQTPLPELITINAGCTGSIDAIPATATLLDEPQDQEPQQQQQQSASRPLRLPGG